MSIAIQWTGGSAARMYQADLAATRGSPLPLSDSWSDALAKLIPGEMIIALTATLQVSDVGDAYSTRLAILLICAALGTVTLWASARRAGVRANWLQYAVRAVVLVLYGFGSDVALAKWLDTPRWILGVGMLVIPSLAAFVLSPPGAWRPPQGMSTESPKSPHTR